MGMTAAYYSEFDPFAAQWLRNLMSAGHIPQGEVDERDMRDVQPEELREFTQHHFFAGIGGWACALRLAGWPDDRPVLTGSPPCQPFSVAGKQHGKEDERHLAPHFLEMVRAIRPPVLFGEQVAAAVKKDTWLDDLLDELEDQDYATGAIVLPACGVSAPHIRQRIFFTGRLGDGFEQGLERHTRHGYRGDEPGRQQAQQSGSVAEASGACRLANMPGDHERGERQSGEGGERQGAPGGRCASGWMAEPHGTGSQPGNETPKTTRHRYTSESTSWPGRYGPASPPQAGWDNPDWLFCRDGKWRPVESGTFPLADGVSGRVGRLRAYGNAIVPQVAAEVIRCVMGHERRGPPPTPKAIKAAMLVINDGWTAYAAAKACNVTAPTVRRQVRRIRSAGESK